MNYAHHASLRVDHGQGVEVVLVEEFGQLVPVQADGTGEDASFSQRGEARLRLGHDNPGERYGAAQHALLVKQIDFSDALRVAVKSAQGLDSLGHGRVLAQGNEIRGHAAGGGFLVELEQLFDLLPLLRFHLLENGVGLLLGQLGQQVGGGSGVHLLDDVGDPFFAEFFEERLLQAGLDLFESFRGHIFVKRSKDDLAFGGRQVFENIGQVGGVHLGQPFILDAQLDAAGRINLDDVNKLPGNAAGSEFAGKLFQRGPGQQALKDAAE